MGNSGETGLQALILLGILEGAVRADGGRAITVGQNRIKLPTYGAQTSGNALIQCDAPSWC
jgi:hypothetical protein